ncbi:MAG: glutathione S-transferase N-terminal domain-containing protein [Alphaproteobacteria bacterium]|nr:glutathione S-transferase N-terminal domain-containing protein [Alphaproteobacteria bacterium]
MKLYFSAASPYVRKVMVTAIETGLDKKIEQMPTSVVPTKPNADIARDNPLMKVPTLLTDGGEALFDSRVICEYLDSLHDGRKLIPASGGERWRVMRLQALADGILDAGLISRYELAIRPQEKQWSDWLAGQGKKVTQGLDLAENENLGGPLNLGQIAIACAIGWLEFRKPFGDVRPGRPKLFKWYDEFAKRPSLQATAPKG